MSTKQMLILAAVLLWSARGLAAGPTCGEDPECGRLYREGQLAYKERKNFSAAVELYEAAYSRVPDPRLLVLIGRSQFKRGNVLQSLLLYNRAWPDIDQAGDKAKLKLFIREAEAALQRPTVTPIPNQALAQQTDPSTKESVSRASRLPPWRLGVGIGFAALTVGSLGIGIALSTLHGQEGPSGACSPVGRETGCAYNFMSLAATSYAAAGLFAAGAAVIFALPSQRRTRPGQFPTNPGSPEPAPLESGRERLSRVQATPSAAVF